MEKKKQIEVNVEQVQAWTPPPTDHRFVHKQEYGGEKASPATLYTDGRCFDAVITALEKGGLDKDEVAAMGQHLQALVTHYSATKAANSHKGQKAGDKGTKNRAGFDWDCDNKCLTIQLRPWIERDDKVEKNNAEIMTKVDAQIAAKVIDIKARDTVLMMMGYKGTPPPYGT